MSRTKESVIDFTSVVTKENIENLTEEELELIKTDSSYHSNYLKNAYNTSYLKEFLAAKSREIAFIGQKYKDQNKTTKEVLAANITFPDNEQFIKVLVRKGITFDLLCSYSDAVSKMRKIALFAKKLKANNDIDLANKKISGLCSIIRTYYGICDYNLILARINQIVAFEKDLYKKVEEEQAEKVKTR